MPSTYSLHVYCLLSWGTDAITFRVRYTMHNVSNHAGYTTTFNTKQGRDPHDVALMVLKHFRDPLPISQGEVDKLAAVLTVKLAQLMIAQLGHDPLPADAADADVPQAL